MSSDTLPTAPQVRPVRIGMTINGQAVAGPALVSFIHDSDNYFSADTWSAEVALSGLQPSFGEAFWADQPSIEIALLASLTDGAGLTPIVAGFADENTIDLDKQTVSISGRDYTGALIDAISNDKFTNQTSSQVATTLAARRGLTPQVMGTTTPVGRFLNGQSGYMAEDSSEWRLLSFLAQQEGFDCYTTGKTLVFAPAVADPNPLAVQYVPASQNATLSANEPRIRLKHRKPLAGPVTVQVRSWQYQTKSAILSTYTSKKTRPTASSNGVAIPLSPSTTPPTRAQRLSGTAVASSANGPFYIVRRSGMTQQQADQLAQQTLADIIGHEREIEFSGPGIIGIDPRRMVSLSGTGTGFDQTYPIKTIRRVFGWEDGCRMEIIAKSGSPAEAIKL